MATINLSVRGQLVGPGYPKFRDDDDASKLGEHVRGRQVGLGRVAGGAVAAAGDVGAVVPAVAYQQTAMA